MDTTPGAHTVDLYLEYKNQFGTPKYSSNVDTPLTAYTVGQLAYFITYIDETVLELKVQVFFRQQQTKLILMN